MESQLEIKQEIIADSHEFNDDEEILETNIKEERNKSPENYIQDHDIKQEKNYEISVHESSFENFDSEDPLISKSTLKENMTIVQEETFISHSYECDFCGKSLKTETKMKKHVKKFHEEFHEGGKKSFQCDLCFADFKIKWKFTRHKRLGSKPYFLKTKSEIVYLHTFTLYLLSNRIFYRITSLIFFKYLINSILRF